MVVMTAATHSRLIGAAGSTEPLKGTQMRGITSFMTRARHLRRTVITSAIVALAMAGLSTAASAATTSSHASTSDVQVMHFQLALDCAHMSASARQYANAHHYCSAAGTATIHPDSTGRAPGNCGTSIREPCHSDHLAAMWVAVRPLTV
jgi:hypothetical protein